MLSIISILYLQIIPKWAWLTWSLVSFCVTDDSLSACTVVIYVRPIVCTICRALAIAMSNTTFPKRGTGTAYPSGHLSLFRVFFITSVLLILRFQRLIMLSIFCLGLYFLLNLFIFIYVSDVSCVLLVMSSHNIDINLFLIRSMNSMPLYDSINVYIWCYNR